MIIPNILEYFKGHKYLKYKTIIIFSIFSIFMFLSFYLGYKWGQSHPQFITPIVISNIYSKEMYQTEIIEPELPNSGYFGSKLGKNAYNIKCLTASRIKEENRVYFKDKDSAKSLGYLIIDKCT